MSLGQAALILVVTDGVAIAAMLLIRSRAPAGSFFKDTAEAAGVFAAAGTTFAVLVAFTFLLAFESYDDARNSSEAEAVAVSTLFHTAEFFAPIERDDLQRDLICYGRAVVASEWRSMRDNRRSPVVDGWVDRLERGFQRVHGNNETVGAAIQNWFTQTDARQTARRNRLVEAAPFVPTAVWFFLIVGGLLQIGFVLFFADNRERVSAQAMLVSAVTVFVVASLVMIHLLDTPYTEQSGSVEPTAMRQTLRSIELERRRRHEPGGFPCDQRGRPAPA
ncbi:MAG: hypothetical protein ACJ76S_09755 [Solirubrobacteraceae bacterium]